MELRERATAKPEQQLDEHQASLIKYLDSTIRLKRKKYKTISDATRLKLIKLIKETGLSIKKVAKKLRINYSTAKSIYKTYDKEGRIDKKPPTPYQTKIKKSERKLSEAKCNEVEIGGKIGPEEDSKQKKLDFSMVQCKAEDTLTDEMKKAGHEEVSQQRLNYNAEIPNPLNLKQTTEFLHTKMQQNRLNGLLGTGSLPMGVSNLPISTYPAYENSSPIFSATARLTQFPINFFGGGLGSITSQQLQQNLFLTERLRHLAQSQNPVVAALLTKHD